jgi:EAL domain-containing protein (putative c-di-GMP-specific phosphodiesterase class I)
VQRLIGLGYTVAQGYHFSRPITGHAFSALLGRTGGQLGLRARV